MRNKKRQVMHRQRIALMRRSKGLGLGSAHGVEGRDKARRALLDNRHGREDMYSSCQTEEAMLIQVHTNTCQLLNNIKARLPHPSSERHLVDCLASSRAP